MSNDRQKEKLAIKFIQLKQQVKALEKEMAVLKETLIEGGAFETDKVEVKVDLRCRQSVALKKVEETAPAIYMKLSEKGFINVTEYEQLSAKAKA